MKKLLLSLLVPTLFFLTACEKEHALEELASSETHDHNNATTRSPNLIDICHYDEDNDTYHIISVNENAVPAFQAQGDAVDMDSDGYFDIPNACSPTDCDDTTYDPTNCGCVAEELSITVDPDGISDSGDEYTLYIHPTDFNVPWGEFGNDIEELQNLYILMYANFDFDGPGNTSAIVADLGNWNGGDYAANLCATLSSETGCEWYLPAAGELKAIREQLGPDGSNDIPSGFYWTSTEVSASGAWGQLFASGNQESIKKDTYGFNCRCVRR